MSACLFIAPHEQEDDDQRPSFALLSVNRQIRVEARPILYGINYWFLSTTPILSSPLNLVEPDLFERINIRSSGNELPDLDRLTMVPPMHQPNFDFGHNGPMTEE